MLIPILIFTLLLSLILSPLTIPYARMLSIMDKANHRSSHVGVTPRGGGIAFVLVYYVVIICYYFFYSEMFDNFLVVILFGSLIMATCGWLDDFKGLSVGMRFAIQIVTVLISTLYLPRAWIILPIIIEKAIITLAWIWFINLFNFMDGTDGYAVQESFFICLGLFLLGLSTGNIALILSFSVLGFLKVNYPKAKIFMGDVGSVFLGYILGGLIVNSIANNELSITQAIVLTSLFLFDATYTLIKRGLQRKKVWKSHREHWYQRSNIIGASHGTIFYIGVVYNLIVICLLILCRYYKVPEMVLVVPCLILISIALYIKKKELFVLKKS